MLAFKACYSMINGDLLGSATTPLPSHGSQYLMALEGELSWGISLTVLVFRDFSLFPFTEIGSSICSMATIRSFVLVITI